MKKINTKQLRRIFSLAILFFSGTGFNLLKINGGILIWFLVLLIININNIRKVQTSDLIKISIVCFILFVFYSIKSNEIPFFIYIAIASAYIVLLNYRTLNYKNKFFNDIHILLNFYMYYTLVHVFFLFFGQALFASTYVNVYYKQIGYLLWYIDSGGPDFLNKFRLCGLAWEPGIWQMYLNLNLLFVLYLKSSVKKISMSIAAIVFTFSTTGLFLMLFILAVNYLYVNPIINIKRIILPLIITLVLSSLILSNIDDKLNGSGATSSMVRFGDFYVGLKMLERSPFIGEDPKLTLDTSDLMILNIREQMWDDSKKGDKTGYMNAELVNGFMIFLLDFGLIVGSFLLYKTFRCNLFENNKFKNIFILVIIITLFSEPISRTGFFYFFVFSSIILSKNSKYNKSLFYKKFTENIAIN